jgi:hypothetical protein
VLACSLLATLVWLVQDDAPARDAGKGAAAQASLQPGAAGPAARPADATTLRDTQPAGAHAVELIVTRDDTLPAHDSMPAGVPGTGSAPAADPSASMAAASAQKAASPALPAAATARGAVIVDMPPPAPAAVPAPTVATAIPAPPAHAAPGMATAQVQPAAGGHATSRTTGHTAAQAAPPARMPPGSQAAPARAPSLARTGPPASHQKRGAAASRTAPPSVVDRDVAVISAILQHTAARGEAADTAPVAPCPDKSCATRMPSRQ